MASQNRSAGYCVHCQSGVTIVRPTGNGFFGRVRNTITNNEDTWVCSKCGNPASKGFTPPPEASDAITEEPTLTVDEQHIVADNPTAPLDLGNQPSDNSPLNANPEIFSVATGPEAICHLCNNIIPFKPEDSNTVSTCTKCQKAVLLPEMERESMLTTSPAIIKPEDDPERPAISKSLCTLCQFEMTYPKKLAGKEVDCPSCSTHFQLP